MYFFSFDVLHKKIAINMLYALFFDYIKKDILYLLRNQLILIFFIYKLGDVAKSDAN